MSTKKCIQCGIQHKYSAGYGTDLLETCQICTFIISSLESCVYAINNHVPSTTGKCNRKLTITGFKIEKIV